MQALQGVGADIQGAEAQPTEDHAHDLANHVRRHLKTSPQFRADVEALIDEGKSDPRSDGKVSRILEGAQVGTVVIITPSGS